LVTKERLNTPIRQASTIATVLANFVAAHQAANVQDDGDLVTLQEQLEAAIASYTASQASHYQLASVDGTARTRNVNLSAGVWQMVIVSYMNFVDPGNYDFIATQQATVVGSLVNMTATASARVVRGGGAGFGRSVFPVLSAVNQMTVAAADVFSMNIININKAGFATCTGAVLTIEKIG
jgi:hypothetical protein